MDQSDGLLEGGPKPALLVLSQRILAKINTAKPTREETNVSLTYDRFGVFHSSRPLTNGFRTTAKQVRQCGGTAGEGYLPLIWKRGNEYELLAGGKATVHRLM